jgi:phage FluMu gp28-like protein
MCGRRWGKSLVSQVIAISEALLGKSVAYVTPTFLLSKVFFDELLKHLPDGSYKTNRSDLIIEFTTGGKIRFFTGTRLDSFRGLKFHKVIIDEASFIPDLEQGWLNSIRPTLTDYQGGAIFLSTPRGTNYFYSLYLKGGEKDWSSFKFTTYDNPTIPSTEIDAAKTQLPLAVFEQEYMANPAENSANPFGNDFIRKCIGTMSGKIPICFGIDLAKSVDWTVVIGLDDLGQVCYFDRFQMDWHNTKENIKRLPKAHILVDSTGVGDPILEDLQRSGIQIEGLKFTSSSKQQLMEGLATAIQQNKITYPEGIITEELNIFEYQFTSNGVKYSAPSGFHDDAVVALALAWSNFSMKRGSGRYTFA